MNETVDLVDRKFRTNLAFGIGGEKGSVDRVNKVINGFAVMTKGFVKDPRGWEIDDTTLQQVANAGNAGTNGLKSRFGHPNMSGESFGTLLGRAKNFRIEDGICRADLCISETAFATPNGDLGTYVMDMAEKEPDMFGSSVVLKEGSFEYRLNPDGTKKKDTKGNELPALLRVKSLSAVDTVDDPAANNGMFSRKFFNSSLTLSVEATEFLNKFLKNPIAVEKALDFLARYGRTNDALNNRKQEDIVMEFKLETLTLDQLKANRGDLVEKLKAEFSQGQKETEKLALDNALKEQKTLFLSILKLGDLTEFATAPFRKIIMSGIEAGESLAAVQDKLFSARLESLKTSAPKGAGGGEVADEPNLTDMPEGVEKWKLQWERDPELQKEFRGKQSTYLAYMNANVRGLVNTPSKKK